MLFLIHNKLFHIKNKCFHDLWSCLYSIKKFQINKKPKQLISIRSKIDPRRTSQLINWPIIAPWGNFRIHRTLYELSNEGNRSSCFIDADSNDFIQVIHLMLVQMLSISWAPLAQSGQWINDISNFERGSF